MVEFLKWSFREMKHVVWPTRAETTNYFITVLIILVLFSLYLFIFNTIFQDLLLGFLDNIL